MEQAGKAVPFEQARVGEHEPLGGGDVHPHQARW
jgi:hypothetical protein